jgi:aminoglycoside phosphotransferase (APT) family kinase protein
MQRTGWTLLDRLPGADVAHALAGLHVADPMPLANALARYPSTLVHGGGKRENLGLIDHPTPRLVLIDWQFVAALPPTVDLAWMLMNCVPMAEPKERVIDRYHARLSGRLGGRFDERTWEPQLRLALIGQTLRVIAFILWAAHATRTSARCSAICGAVSCPGGANKPAPA